MNKIKKFFFKYLDPVLIFLFLFIIVSTLFIYNLTLLNSKIKNFNYYLNTLSNIKILHNEFESLFDNKATFINYDRIVKKTDEMFSLIEEFKNDKFYEKFGTKLKPSIEILDNEWHEKYENIERFKSNNSAIIGSLSYIIELSKKIKTTYIVDNSADILTFDNSLITLIKLFVNNIELEKEAIEESLKNLSFLAKKYNNQDFNFLNKTVNSTVDNLTRLNNIKQEYISIDMKKIIDFIESTLIKEYNSNIESQQKTAWVLFFISLSLLITLIIIYIKSIKTKKELIAFKYAVENSDNSIVMTDKNRRIIYVNESFEKVTGYKREEALGKDPSILKSGRLSSEFYNNMNEILNRGEKWTGEFINVNKYHEIYYETASITPIISDDEITGYLAIKLNITDYVRQQEKVEFLAYHDNLTLLPNRRSLEKKLNELISKATKNDKFAVLFLDLDGFKIINDSLGHDIGDLLLKEIAKRFQESLHSDNYVFRVGGDEFAIIIEYTNDNSNEIIKDIAKNIIKNINKNIVIKNNSLQVGCSIGIAKFPEDGENLTNLLKHSDTAMYKAKQNGKNRFEFYTEDLSNSVHTRLNIEQSMSKGLKNGEFYLVYQPKYNLQTRKIFSVEALLRWKSSILGNIEPMNFISIAEETGFINQLGLFVFKKACEDFKYLQKETNLEMISINVSTVQLMDSEFIKNLKDILFETKLNASNIGIEVTETFIIKNMEEILETLNELRKIGFKIIIDDFGTGYSSMQYLQKLPIDVIKIDKSFIDDLSSNNQEIIKAIVAISKSFGYLTVAEGIELKEQEENLLKLGVDLGQGYFFSKPKTLQKLINYLA